MAFDLFDDDDPTTDKDKEAPDKLRAAEDDDDGIEVTETEGGIEVGPKEPEDFEREEGVVEPGTDRRLTHKEKKQLRYHEQLAMAREEGASTARREAEVAHARTEGRLRELESRQGPQENEEDVALEDVRKRQKQLWTNNQGTKEGSPEEVEFEKEAKKLRDEEGRLMYRVNRKAEMANYDPRVENLRQRISAKYPEMIANEQAGSWMRNRYNQRLIEGQAASLETLDKAAEDTRVQFRMKEQPPPTAGQRARYESGTSAGGGASTSQGRVRLTEAQEQMADGLYDHIKDPKKRYAQYYKTVIAPNREA